MPVQSSSKKSESIIALLVIAILIGLTLTGIMDRFENTPLDFPWNVGVGFLCLMVLGAFTMNDQEKSHNRGAYQSSLGLKIFILKSACFFSITLLVIAPITTGFMERFEGSYFDFPYSIPVIVVGFVLTGLIVNVLDRYKDELKEMREENKRDFFNWINKKHNSSFRPDYSFGNKHMMCLIDPDNAVILFYQLTSGWWLRLPFENVTEIATDFDPVSDEKGNIYYKNCSVVFKIEDMKNPILYVRLANMTSMNEWYQRVYFTLRRAGVLA